MSIKLYLNAIIKLARKYLWYLRRFICNLHVIISTHGYAEECQGKRVISNNLHIFANFCSYLYIFVNFLPQLCNTVLYT